MSDRTGTRKGRERRETLTRERVLAGAVAFADEHGLDALSMRRLGRELGVEAMSLYNHVDDKDDLLDGMVDLVVQEYEALPTHRGWKEAMRRYGITSHEVLLRHPWAASLAESRAQSGPVRMRYLETAMGILRREGFSVAETYGVIMTLDSYIYGFTMQQVEWPTHDGDVSELASDFVDRTPHGDYPHLGEIAALAAEGGLDIPAEFERGLDLILDGLERRQSAD